MKLLPGLAAFVLFVLFDLNKIRHQSRLCGLLFPLGGLLLAASTVWCVEPHRFQWQAVTVFGLLGSVVSAAALIYTLFFALPFQETYAEQKSSRQVYDGGVYALCRHPGILCFFGMFLFLGMAALPGRLLIHGMLFSLLNLAYAWFQDRITFPRTFCDYETYRERVPFLIPTGNSIRLARQTWNRSVSEEDET